ncbi:hypothetical protein ACN47E_002118 [Coniothyrium glycines]
MQHTKGHFRELRAVFRESYHYDALPDDEHFRYLVLLPGTGYQPLQCTLETTRIDGTQFEAISYVWGTSVRNRKMLVDGRTIKITRNLSHALYTLRRPFASRQLWADSICINQDDLQEKNYQVAIMGRIYRAAQRVLIFLGPNDLEGHGPRAAALLEEVNNMITDVESQISGNWDSFPFMKDEDAYGQDARWESLNVLVHQAWFSRGWVVREAAAAQKGQVIWAQTEFEWEKLMRVLLWTQKRSVIINYRYDFVMNVLAHLIPFANKYQSFANIIGTTTSQLFDILSGISRAVFLEFTNPHDRVYAFLDLFPIQGRSDYILLQPNYQVPFLQVYQDFAICYIEQTMSTHILDYVTHDSKSMQDPAPSWVPRWDLHMAAIAAKRLARSLLLGKEQAGVAPKIINYNTMRVRGVIVDTILYTSDTFWEDTTPESLRETWTRLQAFTTASPYPKEHLIKAFLDALSLVLYRGNWNTWVSKTTAFARYLCSEQQEEVGDISSNIVFTHILSKIHNTRFVVTTRGYIGLVPATARKGDACGIIFGCTTPCILRPLKEEGYYTYHGSCFLLGRTMFMYREHRRFGDTLGDVESKDWLEWDVEEQDIYLC